MADIQQTTLFDSRDDECPASRPGPTSVARPNALDAVVIAIATVDRATMALTSVVRNAHQAGFSWRAIGAATGIPWQTIYRRYGTNSSDGQASRRPS